MLKTETDGLTGMLNTRAGSEYLKKLVEEGKEKEIQFGVAFMDIDNFKSINHKYTHPFGDRLLVEIAGIIRGHLKEGMTGVRYGGDEFALIFENTDRDKVMGIMESILEEVAGKTFELVVDGEKKAVESTCSAGVAFFPDDADEMMELLRKADTALFYAKRKGQNRILAAEREEGKN